MRKYWMFCLLLASCSVTRQSATTPAVTKLRLLNKYIVPYNITFNGTTVGGLSGIDYDTARQVYYMICDDRSDKQPARFYTASIPFPGTQQDSVTFTAVTSLRMKDGNVYPATKTLAPDPEALRYNPHTGHMIWVSEGERILTEKDTVVKDPAIYEIDKEGHFIDSFATPAQFHMQAIAAGPRRNGTFEGLGFTPDGRYMFVSLEEPRYEDGPRAGLKDTTAYIRILKYDLHTRKAIAQYAYKLAPVAYPTTKPDQFYVNGISDILVLSANNLVVMERSFSVGVKDCTIRLFNINLDHASDVSNINSLQQTTAFTPVQKVPLLNFEALHTYVDNVEGMTIGPKLPNGHGSLICVADNNFSDQEETQFYVFEIE